MVGEGDAPCLVFLEKRIRIKLNQKQRESIPVSQSTGKLLFTLAEINALIVAHTLLSQLDTAIDWNVKSVERCLGKL